MSNWTHVAAIVRVDGLRFGEEPSIGERFEEIFGKELRYEDNFNVWDEADEHPERFLPLGSEGSLTMNVWKNPDKSCMSAYVVSIFGDLRDHYDPQRHSRLVQGKDKQSLGKTGYNHRGKRVEWNC